MNELPLNCPYKFIASFHTEYFVGEHCQTHENEILYTHLRSVIGAVLHHFR